MRDGLHTSIYREGQNYMGKGQTWHFFTNEKGYCSPESASKFSIPLAIRHEFLPAYDKVTAVHKPNINGEPHMISICAIPRNGGEYLLLRNGATADDVAAMQTEEGLRNIVERLL